MIDRAGAHVVHEHSSHHYACGDLITDYEGIHGHEHYRSELGALYLPTVDYRTGGLRAWTWSPREWSGSA
jgi:hypothetical protein